MTAVEKLQNALQTGPFPAFALWMGDRLILTVYEHDPSPDAFGPIRSYAETVDPDLALTQPVTMVNLACQRAFAKWAGNDA